MAMNRVFNLTETRTKESEDGKKYIEGYFARFNEEYRIFPDWTETIAPGAFTKCLKGEADVKVIWNHNPDIVLGSRKNGTASLKEDEKGLYGIVEINDRDSEALNCYERIKRGDVDGCSFGFDIEAMEETWEEDGSYRTRITSVNPLYEISPCTFPAYESTSIQARCKEQYENAKALRSEAWKNKMRKKLKGE